MSKFSSHRILGIARVLTLAGIAAGLIFSGRAQAGARSGLYQIGGGYFNACCDFAGAPTGESLPNDSQTFLRYTVDELQKTARLTILGADARTVFSVSPCVFSGGIPYDFNGGVVAGDRTEFRSTSAPGPYMANVSYTVRGSNDTLQVNGLLNVLLIRCMDSPTRFTHTNLVATFIPPPRLTFLGQTTEGQVRIMVQGQPGWTDIIEASTDLVNWTAVSTHFMDFSLCPSCPFAIYEETLGAPGTSRFYRAFEFR